MAKLYEDSLRCGNPKTGSMPALRGMDIRSGTDPRGRVRPTKAGPGSFWLDQTTGARHLGGMLIYKIFRAEEWAHLQTNGVTEGAPVDVADGFVHFSTAQQAAETAAKHFAGEQDLTLLAVDPETLGEALKWEPSRGGALFPHLYRRLHMADILWHNPLPLVDGVHQFPEGMA